MKKYQVRHRPVAGGTIEDEYYDYVVIASPLEGSGIEIQGIPEARNVAQKGAVAYQHVHVTLVRGILDEGYFGLADESLLNSLCDVLTNKAFLMCTPLQEEPIHPHKPMMSNPRNLDYHSIPSAAMPMPPLLKTPTPYGNSFPKRQMTLTRTLALMLTLTLIVI